MNKEVVMADVLIFGLSWLSDRAQCKINTVAMYFNILTTCAHIHDCSDHIGEGGKKNVYLLQSRWLTQCLSMIQQNCTLMFYFLMVQVLRLRQVKCWKQNFPGLLTTWRRTCGNSVFHSPVKATSSVGKSFIFHCFIFIYR